MNLSPLLLEHVLAQSTRPGGSLATPDLVGCNTSSFGITTGTAPTGIGVSNYFKPLCPLNGDNVTLGGLVDLVITYMLYIAGALAVIYLLYAGIAYITAGGDETKATKARTAIVNAIIGIIIIVLAFVIEKTAARLLIA